MKTSPAKEATARTPGSGPRGGHAGVDTIDVEGIFELVEAGDLQRALL